MRDVYVAGTGMTEFRPYPAGSAPMLTRQAAVAALRDAGITFADLDAMVTGSARPHTPRGVYLAKELGLTGLTVLHAESASASGLAAIHTAWLAIQSGQHEAVLVLGIDCPDDASLSVQDQIEGEGHLPAPAMYAMMATRRMHERESTPQHLALVAAKNWNYARENNPFATRRSEAPVTPEKVLASRMVSTPLTSMMCTPWGEGAGAVVLCSEAFLARTSRRTGAVARLKAARYETETYQPGHLFRGAVTGAPEMTRRAARAVYDAAGVGPEDIDVALVHDAFAVEELFFYEQLGFCAEGAAEGLVEQGAFGPDSRERFGLPEFSTHGGLIAGGHPGGPTGLAQIWEADRQLRTAGKQTALCHMLGVGTVALAQVYDRVDLS